MGQQPEIRDQHLFEATERATRIEKTCIVCGENATVIVSKAKHARWVAGEHAQDVWPDMTVGDREQIISGTHPACFDKLFGPDEDQNDVDDWDFDGEEE